MDSRSDKVAKDVYVKHLMKCGYTNVQIVSSPVDIMGYKNGQLFYFEIKSTNILIF